MNRRIRMASVTLVVIVLAAGCTSTPDTASADICRHLQDVAIEITQEWIDAAESSGVTVEEWEASADLALGENEAEALLARRDAFEDEWNGYDCAGAPFDVVLRRMDELTYAKSIGEHVVEQLTSED